MYNLFHNKDYQKYHIDDYQSMVKTVDYPTDKINMIFPTLQVFRGTDTIRFNNIGKNNEISNLFLKYNVQLHFYERSITFDFFESNAESLKNIADIILERDLKAYDLFKKQKKELEIYLNENYLAIDNSNLPLDIKEKVKDELEYYKKVYYLDMKSPKANYNKLIKKLNTI